MMDHNFMDKLNYSQTLFYLIQWISKCYVEGDTVRFIKSVDILESNLPEVRVDKDYLKKIDELRSDYKSSLGVVDKNHLHQQQNNALEKFNKRKYDILMDFMNKKGLLLINTTGDFQKDTREFFDAIKDGTMDVGDYEY